MTLVALLVDGVIGGTGGCRLNGGLLAGCCKMAATLGLGVDGMIGCTGGCD